MKGSRLSHKKKYVSIFTNLTEIKEVENVSLNHLALPMPDMISSEINIQQKQTYCLCAMRRCGSKMDLRSFEWSGFYHHWLGSFPSPEKSVTFERG